MDLSNRQTGIDYQEYFMSYYRKEELTILREVHENLDPIGLAAPFTLT